MSVVVPSLLELARRALPQALEAAVVPALLYLGASAVAGPRLAILAPLAWAVGAVSWRAALSRRVPGMVVLALVTLIVRSAIAFAANSTFLYFVQPTIGGIALALAFLGSVVLDRPLVRRFAGEFTTLPPEVLARPAVHRCFRQLSLAWGVYGLVNAALGLWMLVTLTPAAYVALRTPLSIVGTAAMVALSTVWFRRTCARDDLARDDALAERGSDQGVRAVWPGPASIR
jgi:intracellular septation protein A